MRVQAGCCLARIPLIFLAVGIARFSKASPRRCDRLGFPLRTPGAFSVKICNNSWRAEFSLRVFPTPSYLIHISYRFAALRRSEAYSGWKSGSHWNHLSPTINKVQKKSESSFSGPTCKAGVPQATCSLRDSSEFCSPLNKVPHYQLLLSEIGLSTPEAVSSVDSVEHVLLRRLSPIDLEEVRGTLLEFENASGVRPVLESFRAPFSRTQQTAKTAMLRPGFAPAPGVKY